MSVNEKLLNLELDYEIKKEEKDEGAKEENTPTAPITRNLINLSFQLNYAQAGMDDKISRIWRNIRRVLDEAVDGKAGFALIAASDFDTIYKEVYAAKYTPVHSRWASYLYDELDIIKNRSVDDELKVQEEFATIKAVSDKLQEEGQIPKNPLPLKSVEVKS